jgi:hypothetical protein
MGAVTIPTIDMLMLDHQLSAFWTIKVGMLVQLGSMVTSLRYIRLLMCTCHAWGLQEIEAGHYCDMFDFYLPSGQFPNLMHYYVLPFIYATQRDCNECCVGDQSSCVAWCCSLRG